jgi:hypothetical protein
MQDMPETKPEPEAECLDFTAHLARRLGLSCERAAYALGEALLRYEPSEVALRGVGVSHEPVPEVGDPPRRSGVYPIPQRDSYGAPLDRYSTSVRSR